jgi:hypothetical protein
MNPPAKLVAFLATLAAVFGISYVAGVQSQALLAPVPTHNSEMGLPTSAVEGYAVSVVQPTQRPGRDVPVEFAVTAPGGQTLSWLGEDSGEPLHLIAFRRDLTGYQHLMAQQGEGTSWWGLLNLTPGPWHVIIYFRSKWAAGDRSAAGARRVGPRRRDPPGRSWLPAPACHFPGRRAAAGLRGQRPRGRQLPDVR